MSREKDFIERGYTENREPLPNKPFPNKISILGKTYDLFFMPRDAILGNLGAASNDDLTIRIRADLKKDQLDDCILHEIIHMVDQELKLGLSEETVARLACGLISANVRWPGLD